MEVKWGRILKKFFFENFLFCFFEMGVRVNFSNWYLDPLLFKGCYIVAYGYYSFVVSIFCIQVEKNKFIAVENYPLSNFLITKISLLKLYIYIYTYLLPKLILEEWLLYLSQFLPWSCRPDSSPPNPVSSS